MTLTESQIDIATPTGPMRTYVYRPTGDRRWPGLVFYSEIFQRTAPIARMAANFAGHGFVVLVPEVYHELEPPGTVLGYDKAGTDRGNAHKLGNRSRRSTATRRRRSRRCWRIRGAVGGWGPSGCA